jgi:Uma2 family endonuclease
MLHLPRELTPALRLTPEQFSELCAANPEAVLELGPEGNLIEMTPAGGETGRRNSRLLMRLQLWADLSGAWCVFDGCTGFLLPDGSVLSPDASLVRLERWQELSAEQRRGFPPLCPDLVVELASPSDRLPELRRRMGLYQANGARLGWLILPESRGVEVWPEQGEPQRLEGATTLEGPSLLPGLRLDLRELWDG